MADEKSLLFKAINYKLNWHINDSKDWKSPITKDGSPFTYNEVSKDGKMHATGDVNGKFLERFNQFEKLNTQGQLEVVRRLNSLYQNKEDKEAALAGDLIAAAMNCPYYQDNGLAKRICDPSNYLNDDKEYDALSLKRFTGLKKSTYKKVVNGLDESLAQGKVAKQALDAAKKTFNDIADGKPVNRNLFPDYNKLNDAGKKEIGDLLTKLHRDPNNETNAMLADLIATGSRCEYFNDKNSNFNDTANRVGKFLSGPANYNALASERWNNLRRNLDGIEVPAAQPAPAEPAVTPAPVQQTPKEPEPAQQPSQKPEPAQQPKEPEPAITESPVSPEPEPTKAPEPPKTIKVVRHRYGEGEAHDRAVAQAKRLNNKRLSPQELETALQNLQRMEELGLIAKGPKGTTNSDVYLYRLYQSKLYFHLQEKMKMSDGSYATVSSALGSESGKNHREVLKDLMSKKLDDETLKDFARTIQITEGCITNKGEARTTHKIPVRGKYSFKAGASNNVSSVDEEETVLDSLDKAGTRYNRDSQDEANRNAVAAMWDSKYRDIG